MSTIRARFDGKVFIPVDPVNLTSGDLVELDVRPSTEFRRGSPELVRQRMHQPPHVDSELVDELDRIIEESKLPLRDIGPFDDLIDGDEE